MTAAGFIIDTHELDRVVADVAACERELERLTGDLEGRVRSLHEVWDGLAAQSQAEAQRQWEQGMDALRAALAGLRAAARTAHGNYTGAARTNAALWGQVR